MKLPKKLLNQDILNFTRIYYPALLFLFSIFILSFQSNILIWGQDGSSLWFPIVSEFLRGDPFYNNSQVIFSGQNLLEIYGAFPFWRVFRVFSCDVVQTLNLTFFVYILCLYGLLIMIAKGLGIKANAVQQILIGLFCLFSPIILNRVYSGHFNILFGILPFLAAISCIYFHTFLASLFYILIFWFALSIQSYQILAYSFLWSPILIFWYSIERKSLNLRMIATLILSFAIGFLLNWETFTAMFNYAIGRGHRGINDQIVYSYVVSEWNHIYSLILSSVNSLSLGDKSFFYFHELNYPIGFSLALFILGDRKIKKIAAVCLVVLGVLFLFSSNIWPANLIADLPLLSAFRVPQRSLIMPAFLISFLFLISLNPLQNGMFLSAFLGAIVLGQFVPYIEAMGILALVVVLINLKERKTNKVTSMAAGFVFALNCLGLPEKIETILASDSQFNSYLELVKSIDAQRGLSKSDRIVHFELAGRSDLTLHLAANSIGIRTIDGYGHPPAKVTETIESILKTHLPRTNNSIVLESNHPEFKTICKTLGVTDLILIAPSGAFLHKVWNGQDFQ